MTLVQPQRLHPAALLDVYGPHARDDMTVEVALFVMAGDRADHLCLYGDDQCRALVTRAQPVAVRDSPSSTDRVRLRDVIGADDTFSAPLTAPVDTGYPKWYRPLVTLPFADEHDGTPGAPALSL